MDELKSIERGLIKTRRNMVVLLFVLTFVCVVSAFIARVAPVDWRLSILGIYILIPLFLLVMNALHYTDLLLLRFEITPMCPVQDMLLADWEVDDIMIEIAGDEDDED